MTAVSIMIIPIAIMILLLYIVIMVDSQLELCQTNCISSDRLVGPTRMLHTRPHPYSEAEYPTPTQGFCKLGCQLFYTEVPKNTTCKRYDYSSNYLPFDISSVLPSTHIYSTHVFICIQWTVLS